MMARSQNQNLMEAFLDSWDRSNTILVNLLRALPVEEWVDERDRSRIAQMLNESAQAVRDAVESRVEAGLEMNLHYDHPILLLQHMLWHEGYHHGQIKLALKARGIAITDKEAGPVTWGVWMRKR